MEEINIINYLERIGYEDKDLQYIDTRGAAVGFATCKIVSALEYHHMNMWWDGCGLITLNGKRMSHIRLQIFIRQAIEAPVSPFFIYHL